MATCSLGSNCTTKGCIFHDPGMSKARELAGVGDRSPGGAARPATRMSRPRDAGVIGAPATVARTIAPDARKPAGGLPGATEPHRRRRTPRELAAEMTTWLQSAGELERQSFVTEAAGQLIGAKILDAAQVSRAFDAFEAKPPAPKPAAEKPAEKHGK